MLCSPTLFKTFIVIFESTTDIRNVGGRLLEKFFTKDSRVRGVGVSGVSIEMTPDPRSDDENWPPSGHYCIPPWKPAKRDLCKEIRTVFRKDHHCDKVGTITMEV